MSELIELCSTSDVEEEKPLAVNPEGFPPLAVYAHEGAFYVTGNICTHGMAMMTDGYQEGEEIECPFHGGAFNIKTGEATSFPCTVPLKSYPVTVQGDKICIPKSSAES